MMKFSQEAAAAPRPAPKELIDYIEHLSAGERRSFAAAVYLSREWRIKGAQTLQIGSRCQLTFYERELIECCFRQDENRVLLVMRVNDDQFHLNTTLRRRIDRLKVLMGVLEMELIGLVWREYGTWQLYGMHSISMKSRINPNE